MKSELESKFKINPESVRMDLVSFGKSVFLIMPKIVMKLISIVTRLYANKLSLCGIFACTSRLSLILCQVRVLI